MRFSRGARIVVAIASTFAAASGGRAAALADIVQHSAEQWNRAVDDYVVHIEGVHPEPFARVGRLEWERAVEDFRKELPRLSEPQRLVRLMQISALIGDGHTVVDPDRPDFGLWYPLRIVEFPDGYFVTTAYGAAADLAGAQVLAIAGKPVSEVAEQARSLHGTDNAFSHRWHLGALHNAALMRGLGYAAADGSLQVTVTLRGGKTATRTVVPRVADSPVFSPGFSRLDWMDRAETIGPPLGEPKDWITAFNREPASAFRVRNDSHPLHLTLRYVQLARAIPAASAYYVQSNVIDDDPDESFSRFFRRVVDEIDRAKPRHVILDLRNNPGGDGSKIPDLIALLVRHVGTQQNLYVLTGPKTFSAAILLLGDLITFLHPTIVGEPAGAALNHFGDAHEYRLAEIGVSYHVSTVRNVKSSVNDLSRLAPVDVPAPMTFADWAAGRDPAVDPILAGAEMRSFARIAATDGAEAASEVLQRRMEHFRRYPWWNPPTELALRETGRALRERGRYRDAIVVGALGTQLHPDIWNSWYNLGQSQLADNRLEEARGSLRRVLEIDPGNFNTDEIAAVEKRDPATEFSTPALLQWGSSVAAIDALAGTRCATHRLRTITPPFLDSVKTVQQQIDCDGFDYQGGARHLELVFRDGALVLAWLMMRPDEASRVLDWMKRDIAETAVRHDHYVVYPEHGVAWRADKSEILFYSPLVATEVGGWFDP